MTVATFTLNEQRKPNVVGDQRSTHWTLDVSQYSTSTQIDPDPGDFKLKKIERLETFQDGSSNSELIWDGSTDNPSLSVVSQSDDTEAADGADLGTEQWMIVAYGK